MNTASWAMIDQVGLRLRALRRARGWSLDETARRTGVSKAMLGQVERGESSPTIARLWDIATGFRVSLSYFVAAGAEPGMPPAVTVFDRANTAARVDASGMTVHTLVPYDPVLGFELFAIDLAPGALSESAAHAAGVIEHVSVIAGRVDLRVAERWHRLEAGQTLRFAADVPHAYANKTSAAAQIHDLIHHMVASPAEGGSS